jgi:hypothetical protein
LKIIFERWAGIYLRINTCPFVFFVQANFAVKISTPILLAFGDWRKIRCDESMICDMKAHKLTFSSLASNSGTALAQSDLNYERRLFGPKAALLNVRVELSS